MTLVKVTTVPAMHVTDGGAMTEKTEMKHCDTLPLLHVNGNSCMPSDESDGDGTPPVQISRYSVTN